MRLAASRIVETSLNPHNVHPLRSDRPTLCAEQGLTEPSGSIILGRLLCGGDHEVDDGRPKREKSDDGADDSQVTTGKPSNRYKPSDSDGNCVHCDRYPSADRRKPCTFDANSAAAGNFPNEPVHNRAWQVVICRTACDCETVSRHNLDLEGRGSYACVGEGGEVIERLRAGEGQNEFVP